MTNKKIVELHKFQGSEKLGGKAFNLRWLIQHQYRVPQTYVLPYQEDKDKHDPGLAIQDELQIELGMILKPNQRYAVRSSANREDSQFFSYAGQFKTFLDLSSKQDITNSIIQILSIDTSEMVKAYTLKTGQDPHELHMAVIIQEMVQPIVSGVAFSKNPLTGLDEVIVEAVQGSGEALVQEGVTPDRWVNKWGSWIAQPVESQIDLQLIQKVVSQTVQISRAYGAPVDLEWVYDGRELYWLQLRPITHLHEVNIYSNRISKEVFPGMIKPLVWSVNVPLVNSAWIQIFTRLIGNNDLTPDELAHSFAYRAYFNMGVIGRIFTMLGFPKESLELLMGMQGGDERPRFKPSRRTMRHLPRMLLFFMGMLRFGSKIMPELEKIQADWFFIQNQPIQELDEIDLLEKIDQLYLINQKAAFLNILTPLLMGLYTNIFKRQLKGLGVDFSRFDLTYGLNEIKDYDPNHSIRQLADQFNLLDDTARSYIAVSADLNLPTIPEHFRQRVLAFLNHFGHLSDSGNDFSSIPWRENKQLVFQMIQSEAQRQREIGAEPVEGNLAQQGQGQHKILERVNEKTTWESLNLNPINRLRISFFYKRARQFRLLKEAVSFNYTYGYGLFRVLFTELGKRLVHRKLLEKPESIFYLSWEEVKASILPDSSVQIEGCGTSLNQLTEDRKREMETESSLILPEIIYGDDLPPIQDPDKPGDIRYGIPSSGGYYRGPVKVINRIAEFGKLQSGDVLVIPYSDVSWTPLFTRAGAVIAESGGILSHSSIVAREYHIPAVVSVAGAMRLRDEQIVTVDGYRGEVILHD